MPLSTCLSPVPSESDALPINCVVRLSERSCALHVYLSRSTTLWRCRDAEKAGEIEQAARRLPTPGGGGGPRISHHSPPNRHKDAGCHSPRLAALWWRLCTLRILPPSASSFSHLICNDGRRHIRISPTALEHGSALRLSYQRILI